MKKTNNKPKPKTEKCYGCSNNRIDHPHKFRKTNKTCNDCLSKHKERREIRLKEGDCPLCSNNRFEKPSLFNKDNKNCNECISKIKNRNQAIDGHCCRCDNNRKEHPLKFRKKNKTCNDCLDNSKVKLVSSPNKKRKLKPKKLDIRDEQQEEEELFEEIKPRKSLPRTKKIKREEQEQAPIEEEQEQQIAVEEEPEKRGELKNGVAEVYEDEEEFIFEEDNHHLVEDSNGSTSIEILPDENQQESWIPVCHFIPNTHVPFYDPFSYYRDPNCFEESIGNK